MYLRKKKNKILFRNASHALEGNSPSCSYGVSIFDIDGDNELEILVANSTGSNFIYKFNEKKRNFKNIAPEIFRAKNKATLSLCVGDFLGNGIPTVYMQHADTQAGIKTHYDNIFIRTSSPHNKIAFKDLLEENNTMSNPFSGRSVAAIDFNGTGKHSFYVVNYDAPSLFYNFNSESKHIEEISKNVNLSQFTTGRSILAQYIVSKKSLDIYIGNEFDSNVLFSKQLTGEYENSAPTFQLNDPYQQTMGIAIADFDGNGFADLVVGNWNGFNSIFMQKTEGIFENLPPAFFTNPRRIRSVIVADFDNDGNEEIFINNFSERNCMFRYLGNNEWEELDIGPLASKELHGTGAAIGDITGNGFLDIFISSGDHIPQENKLFLGVANSNSWLRIQPLTQFGFPALGSKVRLFSSNGRNQTKYICSGSGYLCQMEPVAHFGLGANPSLIEKLEITWPGDGINEPIVRTLNSNEFSINTFLQIPHPLN